MNILGLLTNLLKPSQPARLQAGVGAALPFPDGNRLLTTPSYVVYQNDHDVRRVRAIAQFDGYGHHVVEVLVNQVVGPAGVRVVWEDERAHQLWSDWRWNYRRQYERVDEAQRDVVRGIVRDGESLTQILGDPESFNLTFLDPLDLPPYPEQNSIEYDARGRPLQYRFRPQHGFRQTPVPPRSLPADQVVHIFREDFPNQQRGVSWLRSAITPLEVLRAFEDAYADIATLTAASPGYFSLPDSLTQVMTDDDALDVLTRAAKLSPKSREVLPAGVEWKSVGTPPITAGIFTSVRNGLISRISRAVGISPYTISGEISDPNFSALRQANIENIVLYRRLQALVIGWLEQVTNAWFTWHSIRFGLANPDRKYETPGFDYIDPAKEVVAQSRAIDYNLKSKSEIIAESGRDPDSVFRTQAEEEAKIRDFRREAGLDDAPPIPSPNDSDAPAIRVRPRPDGPPGSQRNSHRINGYSVVAR